LQTESNVDKEEQNWLSGERSIDRLTILTSKC